MPTCRVLRGLWGVGVFLWARHPCTALMKGLVFPCCVWPLLEVCIIAPEATLSARPAPDTCPHLSRCSLASTILMSLVISALCRSLRLSAGSSDSRCTLFFTRNNHCYPRVEQHLHNRTVCLLPHLAPANISHAINDCGINGRVCRQRFAQMSGDIHVSEKLVVCCRTTSASTAPRKPRRTCCPYGGHLK